MKAPAISCVELSKAFGHLKAVDQLSFDVDQGEIFGFLGPNGAGKSTAIRMVCGLLRPDAGQVFIQGRNLREHPEIANHIGICPQENVFWNKLTGQEQMIFLAKMYGINHQEARKRTEVLLEKLGLADKSRTVSSQWSGGMKRRLNIALALIHDPDMFRNEFLDLTPEKRIMGTGQNDRIDVGGFLQQVVDVLFNKILCGRRIDLIVLDQGHPHGTGFLV